jgi:large subunit ribosomal protein L22
MGARKRLKAEERKEAMKHVAIAKLNNCPTSPRKMRIVADTVRGKDVFQALNILKFSKQDASVRLEKLLRSAIANWEAKHEGERPEDANLVVSEIKVDSARMLKRLRPAPQGRAHRIRKRSNHVTIIVDTAK